MARKPDVDNTETINILSLCTGYGGLELGLSLALEGVFRVVAVEVEAYALANLAAKAQESKLAIEAMWPDCKTFPAERFRGCFDFILAGFPCQPFSVAGKRQGGADDRHLWPHIARIIKTIKPVWVFLENVPGLLSARTLDNRPDLCRYLANLATLAKIAPTAKKRWYLSEHIKRLTGYLLRTEGVPAYASVYFSLRNMGYSVEAGLFTAAECGAPHKRERLFVLAYNETSGFSGSNISIRQSQRQKQTETDSMWISEMENTQRLGRRRGDNGEPAGQGRSLQTQRPSELADTQRTRQSCSIYRQRQVQSLSLIHI